MSGLMVWLLLVVVPNISITLCMLIAVGIVSVLIIIVSIITLKDLQQYEVKRQDFLIDYKTEWAQNEKKECELRLKSNRETVNRLSKSIKWCVLGTVLSSILLAGVPDRKEIAAIVLIPYITSNSEFQKIPEGLAKKLNDYLTPRTDDKRDRRNAS